MKDKKPTKKEQEQHLRENPINIFTCCDRHSMTYDDFRIHLFEAHGIEPMKCLDGKRSMVMHMDGDFWFSSQYEWELLESGLKFSQYIEMARDKKSPFR